MYRLTGKRKKEYEVVPSCPTSSRRLNLNIHKVNDEANENNDENISQSTIEEEGSMNIEVYSNNIVPQHEDCLSEDDEPERNQGNTTNESRTANENETEPNGVASKNLESKGTKKFKLTMESLFGFVFSCRPKKNEPRHV